MTSKRAIYRLEGLKNWFKEDSEQYIAIDKAIKALKENQSDWTPVSEGLPKEDKSVIASTLYGVYPEAKYTKEWGWEWAYEAGMDYWRELKDVTAWMPLPEPYKEENG